jgi:RHS repeat-associated protein
VGGIYEKEVDGGTTTERKYYSAGSKRIAMRVNGTLTWLLGDHLGSTSVTADASGAFQSEMRYTAFGETRYSSGPTPTDYQYTGQRHEAEFGLYFYKARWYDPASAHFTQADSIIPGTKEPLALNRYLYVFGNPFRYIDPSGNIPKFPMLEGICSIKTCIENPGVLEHRILSYKEETKWWVNAVEETPQLGIDYGKQWYQKYESDPELYLKHNTENVDQIPYSVVAADEYADGFWKPQLILVAPLMAIETIQGAINFLQAGTDFFAGGVNSSLTVNDMVKKSKAYEGDEYNRNVSGSSYKARYDYNRLTRGYEEQWFVGNTLVSKMPNGDIVTFRLGSFSKEFGRVPAIDYNKSNGSYYKFKYLP